MNIPRPISVLALFAVLGSTTALGPVPRQEANQSKPDFDWTTVTPSNDLRTLVPCFDGLQCGRLNIPLDHSRTDGPNAIIPVAIIPATDKESYKGSILINPGGPGDSGIQALLNMDPRLSQMVGPAYDIVGFDPRGTGNSIPSAKCFEKAAWATFGQTEIWSLENKEDLAFALARDDIIASQCAKVLGGTGKQEAGGSLEEWGGGHFMNTAAVANDMLSIVQALGQEKLNFIAVSYGSVLGATFASMHPDKVGLMVIDGIADAATWHASNITANMRDADAVVDAFFDLCTKAGRDVCPIAERSSAQTGKRVENILAELKAHPLVVYPHANGYSIVTYDLIRDYLRTMLYTPLVTFPQLAALLAAVEARNTTALFDFAANDPATDLSPLFVADQAPQAISCSDFPDLSKTTFDEAWNILRNATRTSKWVGSIVARFHLECIPWKLRAAKRFEGTIGAKQLSGKLLVVSNVYDPVTPLVDARTIQKRFPGSSLLIQNTIGHCALLNVGSCTAQAIGQFLQTGILPKSGTICEPDELPFVGAVKKGIQSGLRG